MSSEQYTPSGWYQRVVAVHCKMNTQIFAEASCSTAMLFTYTEWSLSFIVRAVQGLN